MQSSPVPNPHHEDSREDRLPQLKQWLSHCLHPSSVSITPLLKEASRRTYYRVQTKTHSYVAMDAPPATEDCHPFIHMTHTLAMHQIAVPTIHQQDLQAGFLLLSDFGDQLLLDQLNDATAEIFYTQAMRILINIHRCKDFTEYTPEHSNPDYWQKELNGFISWYVQHYHKISLSPDDITLWEHLQQTLLTNAAEQPQVLLHKDFHSRNLMCRPNQTLGVLDYQDALFGPMTYDIASLLNDCYIDWPRARIEQWCATFQCQLESAQLLPTVTKTQFLEWFDLTSLQRHLKNLGNFVRLSEQQQQTQFLTYLPRMHQYIESICQRYAYLHPFLHWFQSIHQCESTP